MSLFRYSLEKHKNSSKTKYLCPSCNKKTLTRYVDTDTLEYLNDNVGRCDREVNCNYHLKPSEYFKDSGEGPKKDVLNASLPSLPTPKVFIPSEILQKSRSGYSENSFVRHLTTLFDPETVTRLISTYHLGSSSSRWRGGCIFWFIDIRGRIHAGQVKLFENGHTASFEIEGERRKATTWIHSILKDKLSPRPEWLTKYADQERKVSCLFGEHLLSKSTKPIAIVEAPATAIVATAYLPKFTWLAVGSLSYLTAQRCEVLKGRKVVLYPDLGGYEAWKAKGDALGFDCSTLLEENATPDEREQGLDLRDFLERYNLSEFLKVSQKPKETPQTAIEVQQPEYDLAGSPINSKGFPSSWEVVEVITQTFDCLPTEPVTGWQPTERFLNLPKAMPMMSIEDYRGNNWKSI